MMDKQLSESVAPFLWLGCKLKNDSKSDYITI